MSTSLFARVTLAALALCAARGIAGREDPWALLRALPERVDAAVVIDGAGEQLAAAPGRALSRFLVDSGLFAETARAWRELAGALDLDDAGAVDALLGQRLALIVDFDDTGVAGWVPTARWALVTEVSDKTAGRLRQSLNASPRSVKSGVPIMAVEGGRFELAVVRAKGAEGSTLIVAPSGAGTLLDSAIDALARPRTGAMPALERASGELGPGPIVGFVRGVGGVTPPPSLVAWRAEQTERGWTARVFAPTACPPGEAPAITGDAFDVIAEGALLAVLVPEGPDRIAGALPIHALDAGDGSGVFDGTTVLVVRESGAPEPGGPFTLGAVIGLTDSAPYAQFDALMGSLLAPFQSQAAVPGVNPGEVLAGPSFLGRFPAATRVQPIRLEPIGVAQLVGPRADVGWRYAAPDGRAFAAVVCVPEGADPGASDLVNRAADALERHACAASDSPALFSAGLVRPARLVGAFGGRPALGTFPAALRWIDTLRWATRGDPPAADGSAGPLRGEVTVEMSLSRLGQAGSPPP